MNQAWGAAYLPISYNGIFDRYGAPYNTSAIITSSRTLDLEAYQAYSPLYFPATYSLVYVVTFALATSILVHTAIYYGPQMWKTFRDIKTVQTDIHAKLMLNYREVPWYWYATVFVLFGAISIAMVEVRPLLGKITCPLTHLQVYHSEMPLWGILLSLLIPAVYLVPAGFIYALANLNVRCHCSSLVRLTMSSFQVNISTLSSLVSAYALAGKPVAVVVRPQHDSFSQIELLSRFSGASLRNPCYKGSTSCRI